VKPQAKGGKNGLKILAVFGQRTPYIFSAAVLRFLGF